jgi:hypothetical protein
MGLASFGSAGLGQPQQTRTPRPPSTGYQPPRGDPGNRVSVPAGTLHAIAKNVPAGTFSENAAERALTAAPAYLPGSPAVLSLRGIPVPPGRRGAPHRPRYGRSRVSGRRTSRRGSRLRLPPVRSPRRWWARHQFARTTRRRRCASSRISPRETDAWQQHGRCPGISQVSFRSQQHDICDTHASAWSRRTPLDAHARITNPQANGRIKYRLR